MDIDRCWRSSTLPQEIIWLIVKELVVSWIGKFFSDDRHKFAVIHVTHMVIVNSWFGRPFMKRHFDTDCGLGPAGTFKRFLSCLLCTSSQLSIDEVPARTVDIVRLKFRGADNLDQFLETFFGFLYSNVPIPAAKKKQRPVWIRMEKSVICACSRLFRGNRTLFSKGYLSEVL